MAKRMISRKYRSIVLANIIREYDLFGEWRVYCYNHPKIKSQYRLGNLFLLNKRMLYRPVDKIDWTLNMNNLLDRYYEL